MNSEVHNLDLVSNVCDRETMVSTISHGGFQSKIFSLS